MTTPEPGRHHAAGQQRKRNRSWPAWRTVPCENCGRPAGQKCAVTERDLLEPFNYRPDRVGTDRNSVHMVRWRAYQATLDQDGRRELADAQRRKAQRLSQWPHV